MKKLILLFLILLDSDISAWSVNPNYSCDKVSSFTVRAGEVFAGAGISPDTIGFQLTEPDTKQEGILPNPEFEACTLSCWQAATAAHNAGQSNVDYNFDVCSNNCLNYNIYDSSSKPLGSWIDMPSGGYQSLYETCCPFCTNPNNNNLFTIPTTISSSFAGLDLSQTQLNGANLNRCNLDNANLSGASMQNAMLIEVTAYQTNFSGADLTNTHFDGAACPNASFNGANLTNANSNGCPLATSSGDPCNVPSGC